MKKILYALTYLILALLFIPEGATRAQSTTVVKTWDFESSLGSWVSGPGGATIALSTEQAHSGTQSVKMVQSDASTEINLQNDDFEDMIEGDTFSCWVWISATDTASLNGLQLFWQTGSGWTWNSQWINGSSIIPDTWNKISCTLPVVALPLQRIGIQFTSKSGTTANTPTMYVDDIIISRPIESTIVTQWGVFARGPAPNWKFVPGTTDGSAGLSGTVAPAGPWSVIRGGFIEPVKATEQKAIIVTGKMMFTGAGPETWSAIRYGLFNHDSAGTVINAGTDSAKWMRKVNDTTYLAAKENNARGYMFSPRSGTNEALNWGTGGSGTQGVIRDGSWISSNNPNLSTGVITQKPPRAEADAGTYDFAFSVQPKSDGTKEVRFYFIKDDNKYWYGGTFIDTTYIGSTFNGVCFGLNGGNGAEAGLLRGFNVEDVQVDLGDPIVVPKAPWVDYYVEIKSWGIIGGKTGGLTFVPGDLDGNAGVAGTEPNTNVSAIRGGLYDPVQPEIGEALTITGKLVFEGGGFEGADGLRYGLSYSGSAGTLQNAGTDSAKWSGDENASGYLFTPTSGTNAIPTWTGGTGTLGAVVNSTWWATTGVDNYILGSDVQSPANAVAGPGTYDFSIKVQPRGNGSNDVIYSLVKSDNSYLFSGSVYDNHSPLVANTFNGVAFALNSWSGSTTTAMYVKDVFVSLSTVTGVEEDTEAKIPIQYALEQNYPNPFNPSTTIEFALPQSDNVKLVVYDALGRVVKELASGNYTAGYHKINFNASNLASGVYFYRITAGDFVSVKKLMLLK